MKGFLRNSSKGEVCLASVMGTLALAFIVGLLPARAVAQQDPANQPAAIVDQPGAQTGQTPATAEPPDPTIGQPPGAASQPAPTAARPQPRPPEATQPQFQRVPRSLMLKSGTIVTVRTSQFLSSDQNKPGDGFTAELAQPVVVDGWVVARRGQTIMGRVVTAQKAGRVKGTSQLGIELSRLILVDGQQVAIRSQLMQMSGETSKGRDAAAVGTTTGLGAAIGGAANGGEGAGVGAGIGAAAGIAGVLLTRGRPTVIPPETTLTFELEGPVTISTSRSGPAFRPVEPTDYAAGQGRLERRPRLAAGPYGPYGPPPYYYSWFGPWGYPGPFFVGFSYFGGRRGYRHFHR